ncbi:MAG TPA: transporter [Burkholderiales bacterium]|nr:transporter [Burkholderiales bacterium]
MSSPALASYGSEQCGLVAGYLFAADGRGRAIESDEAARWLKENADREGPEFIWLHFSAANIATEKWLQQHFNLPEAFFEALREGSQSTRIEYAEGALVSVINDVIYDFLSAESLQVATLWLGINRRWLITVRNQPLRSVDRLRMAVKSGEAFLSPLELVIHLMRDQAEVLVSIVRKTVAKVDAIEDGLLAGRLAIKRASLGVMRRDLVRLQRLLAPEPAALFRLLNRPPAWVGETIIGELRQSTEEFSLALRDMAALQERIKLLQEEIAASVNEQTNRTVFVLTAVTVIALPINLISGLFGMNVGGVPYNQDPHGFWLVAALVVVFSILAGWVIFRGRRD